MNHTTAVVSDALEAIQCGADRLMYGPPTNNIADIAIGMLGTISSLMNDNTPEHFTEDELNFISDAIAIATGALNDIINNIEETNE